MIDVMLVLLIIFMIVTPAIMAGFTATVPRADNAKKASEEPDEIRLGIDYKGVYFIDVGRIASCASCAEFFTLNLFASPGRYGLP
jgi:biopolymer transport protein TolR